MTWLLAIGAIVALLFLTKKKKVDPNAEYLMHTLAEIHNKAVNKETGEGNFKGIPFRASPNKSSRGSRKATTIVWHYTAGAKASGAIAWLCNPAAKASAHFVIGRDGKITQLVNIEESAWHVGNATIANATAIGVEVVNPGIVTKKGDKWIMKNGSEWKPDGVIPTQSRLHYPNGTTVPGYWVPYTPAQMISMKYLCDLISKSKFSDCLNDQCGHEDIATPQGRKTDPGPLFPWDVVSTFDQRKKRHRTTVQGLVA